MAFRSGRFVYPGRCVSRMYTGLFCALSIINTVLRQLSLQTQIQTDGSGRFVLCFFIEGQSSAPTSSLFPVLLNIIFICSLARSMFLEANKHLVRAVLFLIITKPTVDYPLCHFHIY
jgi:hypothetical protein